jgi:hypothetical protein
MSHFSQHSYGVHAHGVLADTANAGAEHHYASTPLDDAPTPPPSEAIEQSHNVVNNVRLPPGPRFRTVAISDLLASCYSRSSRCFRLCTESSLKGVQFDQELLLRVVNVSGTTSTWQALLEIDRGMRGPLQARGRFPAFLYHFPDSSLALDDDDLYHPALLMFLHVCQYPSSPLLHRPNSMTA